MSSLNLCSAIWTLSSTQVRESCQGIRCSDGEAPSGAGWHFGGDMSRDMWIWRPTGTVLLLHWKGGSLYHVGVQAIGVAPTF